MFRRYWTPNDPYEEAPWVHVQIEEAAVSCQETYYSIVDNIFSKKERNEREQEARIQY